MRGHSTFSNYKGATVTQPEESSTKMEQQAEQSFDVRARNSGSMGGGASGPRDIPTDGGGHDDTNADAHVAGQQGTGQSRVSPDRGQEEIENYGSRREDAPDELLSPSSQIGRAAQTGGTPESGRQPDDSVREGWPMPDQTDTPEQWPEPTTD